MNFGDKISVIMPVFLGDYPNSSNNKKEKFIIAINSFLSQNYKNKELIIISDGCDESERIYNNQFKAFKEIVFVKIDKQPLFSGNVRQKGLELAQGEYICYLDADDYFGELHLFFIINHALLLHGDWLYFDDYLVMGKNMYQQRFLDLKLGAIGTSNIAHKKGLDITWKGCDNYNHDWLFIQQLIAKYPKHNKTIGRYMVTHVQNIIS